MWPSHSPTPMLGSFLLTFLPFPHRSIGLLSSLPPWCLCCNGHTRVWPGQFGDSEWNCLPLNATWWNGFTDTVAPLFIKLLIIKPGEGPICEYSRVRDSWSSSWYSWTIKATLSHHQSRERQRWRGEEHTADKRTPSDMKGKETRVICPKGGVTNV